MILLRLGWYLSCVIILIDLVCSLELGPILGPSLIEVGVKGLFIGQLAFFVHLVLTEVISYVFVLNRIK